MIGMVTYPVALLGSVPVTQRGAMQRFLQNTPDAA
jgi:hypothetical protein